jgi:hypothetical protein
MSEQAQRVDCLQRDLAVPLAAIALGLRRTETSPNLLPMVFARLTVNHPGTES